MKKVCVVSTTRAEYSYFKPLLEELLKRPGIKLQLIASGTHVELAYGNTVNLIRADGFEPDKCVSILSGDSQLGILHTMSKAVAEIGQALADLKPDMVVLLGDRYEIFAVAGACTVLNIPIAHIGGGETTCGAFDEVFRHSITKMSYLHFTYCEAYRKRVIQLGEAPDRVFNVGSLSLENLKSLNLMPKQAIDAELGLDLEQTLLATFHPVTLEPDLQLKQFEELLKALVAQNKYTTLFTRPNADTNASQLNALLDAYIEAYYPKLMVVESLGALRYFSAMKYCAGVIGNSSSGILEAPSFKIPTINIGNRQKGRIQAHSVINCEPVQEEIAKAVEKISCPEFQASLKNVSNPYQGENVANKIADVLVKFLNFKFDAKIFYDA